MLKSDYQLLESYMLRCMSDSAHDKEHIYRVLYVALDIAAYETKVNMDVLIAACLLHDIGRAEQINNPKLCHAVIGSEKAYKFLVKNEFDESFARHVQACILTHRFRNDNQPKSIEAKILFDADKIDVTGTLGIARTLTYNGAINEPLYSLDKEGRVMDGSDDVSASFFHEYKYKLEQIYEKFFTERGSEIGKTRQKASVNFYESMLEEVQNSYDYGVEHLEKMMK